MPKLSEVKEEEVPKKKKPSKRVKAEPIIVEESPTLAKEETSARLKAYAVSNGLVYVEKGITKNMGDFNSTRVTVGITLPFNPTDEQIKSADVTLMIAHKIVDGEMEKQIAEISGEL
jgi:hypothetical protein